MRTDDVRIVQECLNGEPGAFGVLVDQYKEGIYAFVYDKLRDFHDAQDVTQEVFLQAYRGLRSLRRWESFGFWLYRIAYARCAEWLRVRSKRVDQDFIEEQNPKVMDARSLDLYREDQLSESIGEALDSLPETYREVLTLYYFGGMNSVNIAKALGTSPTAIRHRLSRARAQLREEMIAMMDTAFEGQRLQAGFTFRIVEAVKRIKIQPMPRATGLPWGLSLATGIMVAVMTLGSQMAIQQSLELTVLPGETRTLKVREMSVDILSAPGTSIVPGKQGDIDGGGMDPRNPHHNFLLAQAKGGGTWTQKADMPTPRGALGSVAVNGKIYSIGGSSDWETTLAVVEEYNPETDTWIRKADMPTPRALDGAVCAVNGKIYAIGGWPNPSSGVISGAVEEYDTKADKWIKKADMPTQKAHHAVYVVNGKIYVIGGYITKNVFAAAVEEYDPVTDKWTKKAEMPTPRAGLAVAAVNGKIYAIGGDIPPWWDGPISSVVEEYDPVMDKWTRKADMPTPRETLTACALGGKIYAIGGTNVGGVGQAAVEEYDPETDTWQKMPDLPTGRGWISSSVVNGKIYVIGGLVIGPVTILSSVDEYTPEGWEPKAVSPQGKLPTKWGEVKSE